MTSRILHMIAGAVALLSTVACSGNRTADSGSSNGAGAPGAEAQTADVAVRFDADSAYGYVARQLEFGPRVPGTASHDRCGEWLCTFFETHGADTVLRQTAVVTAFDGTRLPITNIMARYNTANPDRILLLAHWDTRPWADSDPDPANHRRPIPGANDGASGVAVLLEIARQLQQSVPSKGIDLLLVDAEDYGSTDDSGDTSDSWCLGTQYFVNNSPYDGALPPRFAILLDMVGGSGAVFTREYFSERYASPFVDMVWKKAADLGLGHRFVNRSAGAVTDDHVVLNRAGIPAIDIIECANPQTGSFPPQWHTMDDDLPAIDRTTLGDVGRTVMAVIYS